MKKAFVILLATLMLSAACTGAAVTLDEYQLKFSQDRVEWIDGTNLLVARTSDGYTVIDLKGDTVIGSQEDYYSFDFDYGYLVVQKYGENINDTGLLTLDGSVVMPVKYGDVEVYNEYWAMGCTLKDATPDNYDYKSSGSETKYYLIDTVDLYYLPEQRVAISLPRANFKEANSMGRNVNILDRTTDVVSAYAPDGSIAGTDLYSVYDDEYAAPDVNSYYERSRYGLKDWQGNVVLAPTYDLIYSFYGGYAEFDLMDKIGVINAKGEVVLPAEFDDVLTSYDSGNITNYEGSVYGAHGYYAVEVGGKFGYADPTGAITLQPKYTESAVRHNGASATIEDMEGKTHILAADGVETVVETAYNSMYDMSFSGGMLYRVANDNYDYGILDWHGEMLLPCEYDSVDLSGDGQYLLVKKGGKAELFVVNYGTGAAPAVQEETAQPAASEQAASESATGKADLRSMLKNIGKKNDEKNSEAAEDTTETVTETPAPQEEAPVQDASAAQEAPAQTDSAEVVLIDNAIFLLTLDAKANGAAARTMLTSASMLLAGKNDQVVSLLTSAETLLLVDPVTNASSVIMLLETAKTLL